MFNEIKNWLMIFICLFVWQSYPIVVGSNSAVSVQAPVTFPSGDSTNTMLGFAQFSGGFVLTDTGTQCLFNSRFPVAGILNMRGGVLNFAVDMNIENVASFASTGTFNGNSFPMNTPEVSLSSSPFIIPMNIPNATVFANRFAQPSSTFSNYSVDWSAGDSYVAVGNSVSPNLSILQFNQSTYAITQLASATVTPSSSVNVAGVRWHPTLLYVTAAIETTSANSAQIYLFTPPSTLTLVAGVTNGHNGYAAAWHPSGNYVAFGFDNGVIVYSFNGSTLTQVASDLPGFAVNYNTMSWSSDGKYLVAGYQSTSLNELRVDSFNGSALTNVASYNVGFNVEAAEWNPVADFIGVGIGAFGSSNSVQVFQFNRSTNSLTSLTNSYVGQTNWTNSMSWSPDGQSLLATYYVSSIPQFQIFNFNPYTFVLSLVSQPSRLFGPGCLCGKWSRGGKFIAIGEFQSTYASFYNVSVPYYLINLKMVMNSDVTMYGLPTFQGNSMIDGNGYKLDISKAQGFTIGSGATLLLKNVNLYGVAGSLSGIDGTPTNRPDFTDTTGVLQLQDMTWTQTADYTFSKGAFTIRGDVLFTGTSKFIYSTSNVSTINANSQLMFDNGMTFSYAPPTSSINLLQMTDQTSQLYLLNTSLFAPSTGFQLTKGSLFIDGACSFTSFATSQAQGISFGDGALLANNLTIKVLPESGVNINSGFLFYNNV